MLRRAAAICAALMALALATPSTAADKRDIAFAPKPMDSWIVTVNANALMSPKWAGSKDYSVIGFPSVSFRKAGQPVKFSSPDDGISFDVYETENFALAPVFRYAGGRSSRKNPELAGVHGTRWTVEGGLQATYWVNSFIRTKVEVRRGFRDKDGFQASFGADLVKSFNKWTFAIGPRLTLADSRYLRYNFGVTREDAYRANNLNKRYVTPYEPGGGVKSVGVYSSATYVFNQSWSTTVHGGYDRLVSQAGNSPVVAKIGTANQYTLGMTIAYSFPVKW